MVQKAPEVPECPNALANLLQNRITQTPLTSTKFLSQCSSIRKIASETIWLAELAEANRTLISITSGGVRDAPGGLTIILSEEIIVVGSQLAT
jgi:hypothetical protein